ncbi:substrate-binding domain-containing protein [Cetobacterium sp. 2A]|uniref:substrate-binding domain-containing protein n=1 Tax=unclassified Cetobacterium TaxID=2630983 RepID=UPI00163CC7BC|nr:substrate-binding domain-containing protein [Cetobacterium sp. 2A]MBC2857294.1 substrate-binding domain-containing protein [Cetobacterium sp. 2A]
MKKLKEIALSKEGLLFIVFILMFTIFSIISPNKFFTYLNLESMAFQLPELGILSIAMMVVILTGGINLSVTSACALSGIVGGYFLGNLNYSPELTITLSILMALLTGGICGYINGFFVSKIGVTPMLATLGTMTLFEGVGLNFTKGGALGNFPLEYMALGNDVFLKIPIPFIIFILVAIISTYFLEKTKFGLEVYMTGDNQKATYYSGVNTKAILNYIYIFSGILSAIASIIMISRYNSAKVDYGASYLLLTITAAVLGGTNITGGYGKVFGTVTATMILQILTSGLTIIGIDRFLVDFILGMVLLSTILIQYFISNRQETDKTKITKKSTEGKVMKKSIITMVIGAFLFGGLSKGVIAAEKKIRIVVMPKLMGIPYFNAAQKGAEMAGKDLGIEVSYVGPTTADAALQVKMLEDILVQGVDAIAVAPNDPSALTPVLMKAKKMGVKVLDWDTAADPRIVDASIKQIDDKEYAIALWDSLVKVMGKEDGNYAIVTGGLSAANLNTWIDLGLEYSKKRYPNLKLVTDKVPSDEMQQLAYQKSLELMTAYPNLDGIIGVGTISPIGAAQAVKEKGMQDKVAVVGVALPMDSKPYLNDGALKEAILWDPVKLGYLTVFAANELVNGRKLTNDQDIPKVGKIKSEGKNVIMGKPTTFTKENVENYDF